MADRTLGMRTGEGRLGAARVGFMRPVLLAVAIGLATGGCASAPPGPRAVHARAGVSALAPSVGDCWQEPDYGSAASWSWWKGGHAVDCGGEHNSITIAVGDVARDFVYEPSDGGVELSSEQYGAVSAICRSSDWQGIGLREGSRVTSFSYLPTPKQWAAGARWVRCDVALVALGPLSPMTLEALPAKAEELRPKISGEYRLCLDTPHPASVYGPWYDPDGNVAVPCDNEAQWEFGLRVQLPDGPFPGEEGARSAAQAECQELVDSRVPDRWNASVLYPNEETWLEGSRSARCWLR